MPPNPPLADFLSVTQAADELGLAPRTILHRISAGQLVAQKMGDKRTSAYLISKAEVERVKAEGKAEVA